MLRWEFNCTGNAQSITLPKGKFKFEIWGAQGGPNAYSFEGGLGGYSWCYYNNQKQSTFYIYVGCQGVLGRTTPTFGNGGATKAVRSSTYNAGSGGGGTDIRLSNSLDSRILVAGGGGGSSSGEQYGGYGGGIKGGDGKGFSGYETQGFGATDMKGGSAGYYFVWSNFMAENGSLGTGGNGIGDSYYGSGGGGGYYGGGGSYESGGGGGSGYVDPLLRGKTISGNEYFIQPDRTYKIGRRGDGYALITVVTTCSLNHINPSRASTIVLVLILLFVSE